MRARTLAIDGGLALVTAVLMLVPAELFLRSVAPVRTAFYEFDPHVVYRPRPGAAQTFTYPHLASEKTVTLRFNRRGYRGGDEEPPPGADRVAVFGDSFVEARLTREEHTFAVQLAEGLAAATGRPFTSINAGVSGYGPDQELLRIESELPALAPRLLVVVIYAGNDAGDLVRNGLFRLRDERLLPTIWKIDDDVRRALEPSRGWRGLALARAFSRLRARAGRGPEPAAPPAADAEAALLACRREYEERLSQPYHVQPLQSDHYDADLALDPSSASAVFKQHFMRAVLARLRGAAAARRVPLLLVLVPHPTDATRGWPYQVDAARFPGYERSALTDAWAAAAREAAIPFIDLFPPFWEQGGDAFYFARDGHWNVPGQELAARLAVARVQQEGWLR